MRLGGMNSGDQKWRGQVAKEFLFGGWRSGCVERELNRVFFSLDLTAAHS